MKLKFLAADVFDLMGLGNLPDDKKVAMLSKMNDIVGQRVIYRIMDELSEEDGKELDKLIANQAGQEEVNRFLNGKVDLDLIVTQESAEFKEQLSGDFNALAQSLKK